MRLLAHEAVLGEARLEAAPRVGERVHLAPLRAEQRVAVGQKRRLDRGELARAHVARLGKGRPLPRDERVHRGRLRRVAAACGRG